MAKAKATADFLTQLSSTMKKNREDILSIKSSMDQELRNIPWDDPVGLFFTDRYYSDLKPIDQKLVPNLEAYGVYLDQEVSIVNEYGAK